MTTGADIREAQGPNAISRENTQRRFIVSIKPTRSDAGELVAKLQRQVTDKITLPTGVCGLVTSTLVGFAITPALFRLFGRRAALRTLDSPATL